MPESSGAAMTPSETDPYRDCAVYLEHGACVCSTGYPSSCTADSRPVETEPISSTEQPTSASRRAVTEPVAMGDVTGISFGAGVQSTTLLLMALEGRIHADFAIFADTQDEPQKVYEHLWRMAEMCAAHHFPLYVVTVGQLSDEIRKPGTFISIPAFGRNLDGKAAQLRRQCSYQFKLRPMRAFVKRNVIAKGQRWQCLVGISQDEFDRAKPSGRKWVVNSWPLLDLRMRRYDCVQFCRERGIDPPRSACVYCPYHDDAEWRDLEPAEFDYACEIDDLLRVSGGHGGRYGDELYLHDSMKPLRLVDLSTIEDRGQGVLFPRGDCMGACAT